MSISLESIINKSVLVGLSYFDLNGNLLQQHQLCGLVVETDKEKGIAVKLLSSNGQNQQEESTKEEHFVLPSSLSCWFNAPKGQYKNADSGIDITDPDYLVTWDIYKKQDEVEDGTHQWWEWVPNTAPPQVSSN
ncbi:MAG: hypothetical protein MI867_00390 [Pseudomonadales bacterium]|nr:hypothetical protein [Pseudomonadales bacterium]